MLCKASGKKYSVRVARVWFNGEGSMLVSRRFAHWMASLMGSLQEQVREVFFRTFFGDHRVAPIQDKKGDYKLVLRQGRATNLSRIDRITVAFVAPSDSFQEGGYGVSFYSPDNDQFNRGFGSALAVARALVALGDPNGAQEVADAAKIPLRLIESTEDRLKMGRVY